MQRIVSILESKRVNEITSVHDVALARTTHNIIYGAVIDDACDFKDNVHDIRLPSLIMNTTSDGAPHSGLPLPIVMRSNSKVIVRLV